jgi:hypothetical protein
VIQRVLSGFADVESAAAAGLVRAIRAAARKTWAARWRAAWAAMVTLAAVVILAGAMWLAAAVAAPSR